MRRAGGPLGQPAPRPKCVTITIAMSTNDGKADPDQTYRGRGWSGYGDWLGTGRIANFRVSFLPFEQARIVARGLALQEDDEGAKTTVIRGRWPRMTSRYAPAVIQACPTRQGALSYRAAGRECRRRAPRYRVPGRPHSRRPGAVRDRVHERRRARLCEVDGAEGAQGRSAPSPHRDGWVAGPAHKIAALSSNHPGDKPRAALRRLW